MSIERDDSTQNQCLLRKSRGGANTVCKHVCVPVYVMAKISIQACDAAYFLPVQSHCKFGSKWLLSCTFSNGGVTHLFVSSHRGTWRVFKKVSLVFIYLTAQASEPSVLTAFFYKLIADFCISKIQFCCSCFSIFWINHIYSACSGKGKQYCQNENHHCMSAHAV